MLVDGPTAAQFDLGGRLSWLAAVVLGATAVVLGPPASIVLAALSILAIVGAVLFGVRSSRVVRLEKQAGYSTVFDVAGYELRDPRTRNLVRAADVAPENPGRRSIFRSMLSVKPGTVLARRLEDDEN